MADDSKGKPKSGLMAFVVLALLLTLVGAGAGFTVGSLIQAPPEEKAAAAPEAPPKEEEKYGADPHASPAHAEAQSTQAGAETEEIADLALKLQPFPPVLTTLAAPSGRWVRLEGSALLAMETKDSPELLAEKAAEQVLTYLRTVRLEQIEGPSGVLGLREDLNEMVKVLSEGQVQGILLHGLVVE